MSQVVANISKDSTTENGRSHRPVPVENGMCKLPKGGCECKEQCWRHDESELVHRKIVVNTMKEEMGSKSNTIVREESGELLVTVVRGRQNLNGLLIEMK